MWASFFSALLVSLVSNLLLSLITPSGGSGRGSSPAPQPARIQDNATPREQEIPDTEESTSVPVIFGTICLKSPKITTYANPRTTDIIKYTEQQQQGPTTTIRGGGKK